MPISIKANNNVVSVKLNKDYGKNMRVTYDKLIKDKTPSYKYLDVLNTMYGFQGDLRTLGTTITNFNGNFPLADGCVSVPKTLIVGDVNTWSKKEYKDDPKTGKSVPTGKLLMRGIKLSVCDGSVALGILGRNNDDFDSFERELAISCTFEVVIPSEKDYDDAKEDNCQSLKQKYIGEFVQLEDFYVLPKWVSYTDQQGHSHGRWGALEVNANNVKLLSQNKG